MKTLKNILIMMAVTGLLLGGCKKETSQPPAGEQIRQEAESTKEESKAESPKEEAPKAESPAEEPKKEDKPESPMQPESES
jgi:hypothetical protein